MARLEIETGEWQEQQPGLLYAKVHGLSKFGKAPFHAFALRVKDVDDGDEVNVGLVQQAADEDNEDIANRLYALCDVCRFETVKLGDWGDGWVIWVEPAS